MRALRIVYSLGLFLLVMVSAKTLYTSIAQIKEIECYFDDVASEYCQQKIAFYATNSINHLNDRKHFIREVLKDFPILKSVTCQLSPDKKLMLSFKSHSPHLLINNAAVYLKNSCADAALVAPSYRQKLPNIKFNSPEDKINSYAPVVSILDKLPQSLIEKYEITIFNEEKIKLFDKQFSQCSIICSLETIPNEYILQLCEKIFKEQNVSQKNHSLHSLIADIRFKDQIVLYGVRGG